MATPLPNHNESAMDAFFSEPDPIISDKTRDLIENFLISAMFLFAVLGTVTNVINIRVFVHQGVTSDTNTICLFALAIADFLGCLFLVPRAICQVLKYTSPAAICKSCLTVVTIGFNSTHLSMSRVNCWITVYIAIERSLCVLIPFKVKIVLKPRVAGAAMLAIYVIIIGAAMPYYVNVYIKWQHNEKQNATIAILFITAMGREVSQYLNLIFNTVLSAVAIVITAIATGLMLYKLNKYKKWRAKAASVGDQGLDKGGNSSTDKSASTQGKRDVEVVKTVSMITGLFIACLSMNLIPGFVSAFVTGSTLDGVNKNLIYLFYSYKYVFDVINSSLNFFFYVRVSSRYKAAYKQVFHKKKDSSY